MPPVLNISLDKLPARRANNMLARNIGIRVYESHRVLKLVAEPECSARLIERGTSPHPGRQGLVQRPAIHHQVEARLRGLDLDGIESLLPALRIRVDRLRGVSRRSVSGDDGPYCFLGLGRAKKHYDVPRFPRVYSHAYLQGAAWIDSRADGPRQSRALQGRRTRDCSVPAEELSSVSGIVGHPFADRGKRDGVRELRVEVVPREHRLRWLVEARANLILCQLTRYSEYPFQVPGNC